MQSASSLSSRGVGSCSSGSSIIRRCDAQRRSTRAFAAAAPSVSLRSSEAAASSSRRPRSTDNNPGRRRRRPFAPATAATAADDVQPVPPAPLTTPDDPESLRRDADWIAGMVALWLDEEFTPQSVHLDLGRAAGASYARLRAEGEDEMGGLLMGLVGDLSSCDYREQFVGPFDVANKVVEMLMLKDGTDVCCTTEADATRAARLDGLSGGSGGGGGGGGGSA